MKMDLNSKVFDSIKLKSLLKIKFNYSCVVHTHFNSLFMYTTIDVPFFTLIRKLEKKNSRLNKNLFCIIGSMHT